MLKGFDEASEDSTLSASPNALALYNPVLEMSKHGFGFDKFPSPAIAKKADLMGAIAASLPPTLIFHGVNDRVVPVEASVQFAKKMKKKKNFCEVVLYEGQGHGFFNFNVSFDLYQGTLLTLDDFLVSQGFIEPDPDAGASDGM